MLPGKFGKISVTLQGLLSEACRCTATVILPDIEVGVVGLAMSLLVGSVGEEGGGAVV